MTEKQILEAIKNDPQNFVIIYNDYYRSIFNYCYRRTDNFDLSLDLCAEVFLKAFIHIGKFEWKKIPIKHWLYRIATNELKLYFRSRKYTPQIYSQIQDGFEIPSTHHELLIEKENAQMEMEKSEEFLKLHRAVKKLPLKYQEAMTLKYFENLKIKDIAAILKKKEGTVKSLLSRALVKLQDYLLPMQREGEN